MIFVPFVAAAQQYAIKPRVPYPVLPKLEPLLSPTAPLIDDPKGFPEPSIDRPTDFSAFMNRKLDATFDFATAEQRQKFSYLMQYFRTKRADQFALLNYATQRDLALQGISRYREAFSKRDDDQLLLSFRKAYFDLERMAAGQSISDVDREMVVNSLVDLGVVLLPGFGPEMTGLAPIFKAAIGPANSFVSGAFLDPLRRAQTAQNYLAFLTRERLEKGLFSLVARTLTDSQIKKQADYLSIPTEGPSKYEMKALDSMTEEVIHRLLSDPDSAATRELLQNVERRIIDQLKDGSLLAAVLEKHGHEKAFQVSTSLLSSFGPSIAAQALSDTQGTSIFSNAFRASLEATIQLADFSATIARLSGNAGLGSKIEVSVQHFNAIYQAGTRLDQVLQTYRLASEPERNTMAAFLAVATPCLSFANVFVGLGATLSSVFTGDAEGKMQNAVLTMLHSISLQIQNLAQQISSQFERLETSLAAISSQIQLVTEMDREVLSRVRDIQVSLDLLDHNLRRVMVITDGIKNEKMERCETELMESIQKRSDARPLERIDLARLKECISITLKAINDSFLSRPDEKHIYDDFLRSGQFALPSDLHLAIAQGKARHVETLKDENILWLRSLNQNALDQALDSTVDPFLKEVQAAFLRVRSTKTMTPSAREAMRRVMLAFKLDEDFSRTQSQYRPASPIELRMASDAALGLASALEVTASGTPVQDPLHFQDEVEQRFALARSLAKEILQEQNLSQWNDVETRSEDGSYNNLSTGSRNYLMNTRLGKDFGPNPYLLIKYTGFLLDLLRLVSQIKNHDPESAFKYQPLYREIEQTFSDHRIQLAHAALANIEGLDTLAVFIHLLKEKREAAAIMIAQTRLNALAADFSDKTKIPFNKWLATSRKPEDPEYLFSQFSPLLLAMPKSILVSYKGIDPQGYRLGRGADRKLKSSSSELGLKTGDPVVDSWTNRLMGPSQELRKQYSEQLQSIGVDIANRDEVQNAFDEGRVQRAHFDESTLDPLLWRGFSPGKMPIFGTTWIEDHQYGRVFQNNFLKLYGMGSSPVEAVFPIPSFLSVDSFTPKDLQSEEFARIFDDSVFLAFTADSRFLRWYLKQESMHSVELDPELQILDDMEWSASTFLGYFFYPEQYSQIKVDESSGKEVYFNTLDRLLNDQKVIRELARAKELDGEFKNIVRKSLSSGEFELERFFKSLSGFSTKPIYFIRIQKPPMNGLRLVSRKNSLPAGSDVPAANDLIPATFWQVWRQETEKIETWYYDTVTERWADYLQEKVKDFAKYRDAVRTNSLRSLGSETLRMFAHSEITSAPELKEYQAQLSLLKTLSLQWAPLLARDTQENLGDNLAKLATEELLAQFIPGEPTDLKSTIKRSLRSEKGGLEELMPLELMAGNEPQRLLDFGRSSAIAQAGLNPLRKRFDEMLHEILDHIVLSRARDSIKSINPSLKQEGQEAK